MLGRIFINQIVKNNLARSYIYVSDFMRTQVAECNAVVKQHLQRDGTTFLHGKVSIITLIKSYGGEEKKRKKVSRVYSVPTEMIHSSRIKTNKSEFTLLVC